MNISTNETQDKTNTCEKQSSKYTTIRVFRTKRNKIRRIAEKKGLRIEAMADMLLTLGLESIQNNNLAEGR
jgi:hypothetical protein